jgi:long-chain acyl-CoA synthetase
MNLANLLARAGRVAGSQIAVSLGEAPVATYAELAANAARLADAMTVRLGLTPGDRVAVLMSNAPAYVETLFACWWAGLVAVPINAKLHAREVAFVLADSGSRLLVVSEDHENEAADAVGGLDPAPRVVVVDSGEWRGLRNAEICAVAAAAAGDPAWLFYTSGTTGRPKGAVLSHSNLFAMCGAYATDVDKVEPGEALLHAAPMSHGSGLYILPSVAGFGCQLIPESGGFDPDEIFSLLRGARRVSFFAAPTMVGRLVRAPGAASSDTSNLKTIIYGGGPMYLADIRAALDTFGPKFVQIYGQGETPMTITVLPRHLHADWNDAASEARLSSVGYAQSVVEVVVGDAEGQALPPGEVGEIYVRGATVMNGYWNDSLATARTLRDGWLATGDLGELDADGFLTLRDRSKDVIISGGSNIYPREVEEVLLRHPQVREVSVIGRPHADWGEEVVAFVVAGPGVSPEDLDRLCVDNIARFKRPKSYHFLEALPKNSYGKVLKTELRARDR